MHADKLVDKLIGSRAVVAYLAIALALTTSAACFAGIFDFINSSNTPSLEPGQALPPATDRKWESSEVDVLSQRSRGYGLVNLPIAQDYLNGLLQTIKAKAGVPDWPGKVYILATPALEAYATSAGNIYVGLSWLTAADCEDELVALLSHEFGHIYLHYHQVDSAVQATDQLAQLISVGMSLAKKAVEVNGWSQVLSMQAAYSVGREVGSSVWGRTQESAADQFGLNISLKLGYSYAYGFKTMLERLATWEEENDKRKLQLQNAYFEEVRKNAESEVLNSSKGNNAPPSTAIDHFTVDRLFAGFNGSVKVFAAKAQQTLKGGAENLSDKHPSIIERLDVLANLIESKQEGQADIDAVTKPLVSVRQAADVAEVVKNYEFAFETMRSLDSPRSLELALKSAMGKTATHAYPIMAVYQAQLSQVRLIGKPTAFAADRGALLDRNLRSNPDRSWIIVVERVNELMARGENRAAKKMLAEFWNIFSVAPEAWPDFIRFVGLLNGWGNAKELAADCAARFRVYASACAIASKSPAEVAEADRKLDERANKLSDGLFKRLKLK